MEHDRVAVVTGAAGGIGRAIVERLLESGHSVASLDRSPIACDAKRMHGFEVDVTDDSALERVAREVDGCFGRLDVLVTCAGLFAQTPALSAAPDLARRLTEVNLTSPLLATRYFGPLMARRRSGCIVHVASIAAARGAALAGAYAAAKAGVVALTQSHARELAPAGIAVNAVLPGYTDTPMLDPSRATVETFVVPKIPLGRLGSREEVAEVAHFLATVRAGYLTGAVVAVDGGLHVG